MITFFVFFVNFFTYMYWTSFFIKQNSLKSFYSIKQLNLPNEAIIFIRG